MGFFEVEYLNSKGRKRRTMVFAVEEEVAIGITRHLKGTVVNIKPAKGILRYFCVVLLGLAVLVAASLMWVISLGRS